ncbi:cysteine hydrolase [Aeromonas hydrophila]|uniref:cysteine hydrolase n=1 Tax=Aeromonas hydrophila TaxID=644 RepID=UPI00235E469B|nr:cysteine hydrolase [Aeromonas hydrophila]WDA22747.1 cysteine hydrolase [Aeromonas hydrophila]WES92810.1 cysteine hydrolase [Aeromonas hydrophila]
MNKKITRRDVLSGGVKLAAVTLSGTALSVTAAEKARVSSNDIYKEPPQYGLPRKEFLLDLNKAALVVVDPQVDFLSEKGVSWAVMGDSIRENNTVNNIEKMFINAKNAGIVVAVSPHYYYPTDYKWKFGGPGEHFMHDTHMFYRSGSLKLDGFENSGADFLEQYKKYIFDAETIIASPHKIFGPETNDLTLQLRKRGVSQILLAGMAANLCIESHLRELIEQGFEVVVIKDATAGPKIPEGDGYLAAIINYRFIANDLWTTEYAVSRLKSLSKV